MVLLENYNKRTIREDTIYSIKPEIIQTWRKQSSIDSFLIGYIIDVSETQDEIFNTPVSLDESFYFFLNNIYGGEDIEKIPFPSLGKSSVTIRNVGQGNWNEINYDNKVKVVYDAGQGKRIKI
ncbi:hypothetical protein AGMMS4957_16390 [Bacteroidia bacterium]|nr:hypothetical protein AGMMS4957_16390 [Bacteroidia bacterium]